MYVWKRIQAIITLPHLCIDFIVAVADIHLIAACATTWQGGGGILLWCLVSSGVMSVFSGVIPVSCGVMSVFSKKKKTMCK